MLRPVLSVLVVVFVLTGCDSSTAPPSGLREVTGVVTQIETGQSFGAVETFSVRQGEQTYRIYVDHEVTYDFPLAHLNSHRAGAEPVRVGVERRQGKLFATSIGDA
ncbi:MAG: hypothetical protein M3456_01585 [Actinomycetota bacterium]|jgi:hypothetical protein|nr:hypothetical protein [Actinomycetota bacterium]